ncbi:GNAT family N-acetyltransferase [Silvimonas iriomotensis]|uniref:N-acetyltransferase n=1 Tax=Silvimonas iriomotensis TaxID=449662 RepID=A0ABQ2P4Y9_9NEIS|nr:GNAT family N-acetyltransferase [Silvimonas iriomotensis]GGP18477.1 N-acetyltransferase [Silvimonas iriomotensis]
MTSHIRPAVLADAPAIAVIHIAAWQAAYKQIVAPGFLATMNLQARTQRWQRNLSRPWPGFLVALDSDEAVVGWIGYGADNEVPPDCGAIKGLYIAPAHWGAGHGAALLHAALYALRRQGWRHAGLVVLEANRMARAFYEKHGFHTDGVAQPHHVGEQSLPVLLYRRALD